MVQENIHPRHRRDLPYDPPSHPSANSNLASYIAFNFWVFETRPPPWNYQSLLWGEYGYFLEPHIIAVYRIFSIKRPRRLFQNMPCGPGVYLKPALNRGPVFIYEVQFSDFFQTDLLSPILLDQGQFVNAERVFTSYHPGKLSLSL